MINRQETYTRTQLICMFAGITGIVLLSPRYLDMVMAMGLMIPSDDMASDYLKGVGWAFVLGCSIFLWPVSAGNKKLLLFGWLGKIVITLFLMLFYEGHYGLDSYNYFELSRTVDFKFSEFSFFHGLSQNMENIAQLHYLLFPDSYHAMKVSFAMLGLIGIYLFYRSAVIFLGHEQPRLFYLMAFFPGIIFWSSILGKEPIVFFGIGLYTYGVSCWYRYKKFKYIIAICVGILTAMFIRQWLGMIMVAPMGIALLLGMRGLLSRFFFAIFSIIAGYLTIIPFLARFKIAAMEDVLKAADSTTTGFVTTAGGSTQALNFDFSSPLGLVSFLPYGAFTALFRPLPGEVLNPFGLLAGVESGILLVLLIIAVKRTSLSELKEPFILWATLFILIWAMVNGIVSSTNFGVGVRYKLQVLPVLLGLLLYLSRNRVDSRLNKSSYRP